MRACRQIQDPLYQPCRLWVVEHPLADYAGKLLVCLMGVAHCVILPHAPRCHALLHIAQKRLDVWHASAVFATRYAVVLLQRSKRFPAVSGVAAPWGRPFEGRDFFAVVPAHVGKSIAGVPSPAFCMQRRRFPGPARIVVGVPVGPVGAASARQQVEPCARYVLRVDQHVLVLRRNKPLVVGGRVLAVPDDFGDHVLFSEYVVHHYSEAVDLVQPDRNKDRSVVCEHLPGQDQPRIHHQHPFVVRISIVVHPVFHGVVWRVDVRHFDAALVFADKEF